MTSQPQGGTVTIFSNITFQVAAAGSIPLNYQWQRNGNNLPGATGSALALSNVLPSQEGGYRVIVTNLVGAVTSSVANLSVPRVVRVVSTNAPTGNAVSVPVQLLAAGDENSLGFSLRFDPSRLVFNGIVANTNLPNVTVNVNTNQAAAGILGVGAARVVPQTWPLGTQEVATLRFTAAAQAGNADISFADTPAARDLVDTNAASLNVIFQPGTVTAQNVAPTITQQPQSRDVESGAVVAFTVSAAGSLPMTYQWQRNGADMSGATNLNYVIVNAQPSHAGAYSVRIANAGGNTSSSNALLTVTPPDTNGPTMTFARYGIAPLVDGLVVSNSDTFSVNATDPSGVRSVEFYVDGALLLIDDKASDGFAAPWTIDNVVEGLHAITLKAWDWKNNFNTLSNSITVHFFPPPPPVITSPPNGTVVGDMFLTVRGTGLKNTSVLLYRNDQRLGVPIPVPLNGLWESPFTLLQGTNRIQASAQNQAGEGPLSPVVKVVLDTTIPQPPSGVQAVALDGGRIQVTWIASADSVQGYHLYRGTNSFTNKVQAVRLTAAPLAAASFINTLPADGKYFYRLSTVNLAGTEGGLSSEVWAVSDTTPPSALAVQYTPLGSYDPVRQRFGRGVVNVTLTMSEPLLTTPFFSLNPAGGQPILVDLRPGVSNQFLGSFVITESTSSGVAAATLSARDAAGNRGNAILSGGSILIDAVGPEVTNLVVSPVPPIRNQSNAPVQVTFTAQLTEPVRSNTTPQFSFSLSQTAPAENPVSVNPDSNQLTWTGSFLLST